MFKRIKIILPGILVILSTGQSQAVIVEVPGDASTIQEAINKASAGDTILIHPAVYHENIQLTSSLTIASRYILDGNESHINETVIDGLTRSVFNISGTMNENPDIIGLTIRNGEDGIMATSPFNIYHCIITACEDGIDYETGSGGQCCYNIFRDNLDDGIDLDGSLKDVLIMENLIADNDDDGIEIRLHPYQGETLFCQILNNRIMYNKEDGIQFIDYADTSSRVYIVERNLILDNKMAAIGLMDDGETREDFRGAAIPEAIYLFNNTISGCQYGITGGSGLLVINNIIQNCSVSGMKGLRGRSVLSHTLFHNNGTDLENLEITPLSILNEDPLLNQDWEPMPGSPCIDQGLSVYIEDQDTLLKFELNEFSGSAPEVGAVEINGTANVGCIGQGHFLTAWPNPCSDYLRVGTTQPTGQAYKFCILDLAGKVIAEKDCHGTSTLIGTKSFPAGTYLLYCVVQQKMETLRIIKL
jgi:hypothetical protein